MQIETTHGKWNIALLDYKREFRPDRGCHTDRDSIASDLKSLEDSKRLAFYCDKPITINGKQYDRVKAVISWTKYLKGKELPEPILYVYTTNETYGVPLTDAAKEKLNKELASLIDSYYDVLPKIIEQYKASYIAGNKESVQLILDNAKRNMTALNAL